jgi:tRNA-splicing ligase RtcB
MSIGQGTAFDADDPEAIVSPGGVGFDINCGVRMLRSNLTLNDLPENNWREVLADAIFDRVPVGVGGRNDGAIELKELRRLLVQGMAWAVDKGFAWPEDVERCEEKGCIRFDDHKYNTAHLIGQRAESRGLPQLGTLGSGNHYIEVQAVTDIYDPSAAEAMGISSVGQLCVMIHCGSRGLGHQVADDAIKAMKGAMARDKIQLNDPMLACARINSPEGQLYLAQMAAASNFAYVNRSIIAHRVRDAFAHVFGKSAQDLGMNLVYDVAHNIAKIEDHQIDGRPMRLLVHRKGSTRAFPPGHSDLPPIYQKIGQPVLVGGSMGTCSYVLTGTDQGLRDTFGSTCHGAVQLIPSWHSDLIVYATICRVELMAVMP